jgi:hypothetical protein
MASTSQSTQRLNPEKHYQAKQMFTTFDAVAFYDHLSTVSVIYVYVFGVFGTPILILFLLLNFCFLFHSLL